MVEVVAVVKRVRVEMEVKVVTELALYKICVGVIYMSCPQISLHVTGVEELIRRWVRGARFNPCAATLSDGRCVIYDYQYYPATPREFSEFLYRFRAFMNMHNVEWLGDCYDCEDFAQLASALFSAWYKKNSILKAIGKVYYVRNGVKELLGWHGYNIVLYCLDNDITNCDIDNIILLLLEPQEPYAVPAIYPYLVLTNNEYLEYETVEIHPPG